MVDYRPMVDDIDPLASLNVDNLISCDNTPHASLPVKSVLLLNNVPPLLKALSQ